MLGCGNFEDNSSDSAAEDKGQNSKDTEADNGCEYDTNAIDGLNDPHNSNNNNVNKFKCKTSEGDNDVDVVDDDNDCDDSDLQQNNSSAQEIPPPPGAPRAENTARLRRYRLNLE